MMSSCHSTTSILLKKGGEAILREVYETEDFPARRQTHTMPLPG
jgi:hypothetical protein